MKIVINACFGGFSLSREGVLLGRKISDDPKWGGATIEGDIYDTGEIVDRDFGFLDDVPRTSPILIQVVEQLGERASSHSAELIVEEIPSGTRYYIEEYDGLERLITDEHMSVAP